MARGLREGCELGGERGGLTQSPTDSPSFQDVAVTPPQACELLNKRFTTPSPRRQCCVVLLDEVDLLYTKKQDVSFFFFSTADIRNNRQLSSAPLHTPGAVQHV